MVAEQRAQQKKLAAQAAVELVESGMTVGLGSGSTFAYALDFLAERYQSATLRDIRGVASSNQTAARARALGIPLVPLSADLRVDISIDGADEIDPKGRLIKGGGGALLREKLIAEASARPIIIVDESKCVEQLGAFPLPVEVLPFGWERSARFLGELGAEVKRRECQPRSPYLTDNGHYILDCAFGSIQEPAQLATSIKTRTGIIEHGLFIGLVSEVILARASGIEIWNKGEEPFRFKKTKGDARMKLGMVGLGKMGANMTERLLLGGHELVVTDLDESAIQAAAEKGAEAAAGLTELVAALPTPRIVWVMVPHGAPTESSIQTLAALLSEGDILIDGGNSNYKETMRRGEELAARGVHFIDVGTSGGVWGLAEGYSMMIGGDEAAVAHIQPLLETLAPDANQGWGRVGPCGAGHFVKMVHNGIEYGMMQAFAEGFEIMRAKDEFALDLHQIAEIWRYGSVVRSWLLDLTARALAEDPELTDIRGWVSDSGEGRWTVFEAIDQDVPAPVITLALMRRFSSRQDESYAAKILAAMRNQFGGHAIKRVGDS